MSELAPHVFLSYAGEDEWWVQLFRPYFSNVGPVRIFDYKADGIPFGELRAALDEQISASMAVIAFVSKYYREKEWTVAEWEKSLDEVERRRLIFVPIMLDAEAITWWQKLRRDGHLTGLNRDYQYADFTDGGNYALPGPDKPQYIQKIANLALKLRADIISSSKVIEGPEPPELKTGPGPAIVILGHPSASLPADLQNETRQLIGALGNTAVVWSDGWRRKDAVRTGIALDANPIFVQPITDAEADDYLRAQDKTNAYLAALGRPTSRVAIWLPAKYSDAEFERAAANQVLVEVQALENSSILRRDTAEGLAKWLAADMRLSNNPDTMVVQVEGYGSAEDGKPEIVAGAKLIVDRLKDEMWNIVSRLVDNPPPAAPPWQFWDTQFGKQIKILPGSRAIVAVHDLDIPPHPDPRIVRKKVEIKFEAMQGEVEAEQKQRLQAGKPCLKLFWTAMLVNNAGVLPFSNYPDDGKFKDWRLLEFVPVDEYGAEVFTPVPDPASLAVFRTNLIAWAAAP
jgi:hypothetical protein